MNVESKSFETRDHHVVGQPPLWSRLANRFRRFDGTLVDRYMADEAREDDRRLRARGGNWRTAYPAQPGPLKRRWIMYWVIRRQRREFRRAHRNYCAHVHPMADVGNRFAELGHKLMESWLVLLPLALMCLWEILYRAGVFS